MKFKAKYYLVIVSLIFGFSASATSSKNIRVEPSFWWVGMQNPSLQLMVHAEGVSTTDVVFSYPGIKLKKTSKVDNPNYLFLDLEIKKKTKPGSFIIDFQQNGKSVYKYLYSLYERETGSATRAGFNTSDVIYLITPDRFANGDPENDAVEDMKELPNRSYHLGRHGGDIRGIINNLDYLKDLGFTAVWLNPVLESNMTKSSYHGYACTDYYRVDPRYGTNEEYCELNNELDKRGMKLIMDMVFNHCGSEHWWMEDMPMNDWLNNYPDFKIANHRRTVNQDPYASEIDKREMSDGWFVETMPDLNQKNPFMETYLIQNSIWWIEYAGLEGVRQDTWPYPDKNMMARWVQRLLEEYPNLNIVGEEWSMNPAIVSYWQKGKINKDGYKCDLPSLMDFPLQEAVSKGFNEKEDWGTGLIRIYELLANDFQYPDPFNLVILPDNHDMSRFLTQVNDDVDLLKMAIAFFLTTRGIPQIFYGTETLMTNTGTEEHGIIRSDFPGGWAGDEVNAFTGQNLSEAQKNMLSYVKTIQNWRKNKEVVHHGKLKHFAPADGIYTYFRYNNDEVVMIILNKNQNETTLKTEAYKEIINGKSKGKDIISGKEFENIAEITLPAKSAVIIELN